ncbi:MAG: ATP synthase F1 subunit epsilon [Bacteroidales bacterium]|jgi:F-type H+-transporting ATPase subunit epsilon|nr:ATP synthase F1 subunit epsilon [Bacteroidales bacterium]MDD3700887.1 ATP synthase F1 subunit epsilon [Bacteroidales bacterium]MDY0369816.1 ATP synthase F1 subunit epsilon [Bacteroidales bacterium]
MKLEIITPDTTIFTGETSLVQLPGLDGLFEILHNHAPMIAALGRGRVKIVDENKKTQFFEINGGVLEVLDNHILILSE